MPSVQVIVPLSSHRACISSDHPTCSLKGIALSLCGGRWQYTDELNIKKKGGGGDENEVIDKTSRMFCHIFLSTHQSSTTELDIYLDRNATGENISVYKYFNDDGSISFIHRDLQTAPSLPCIFSRTKLGRP